MITNYSDYIEETRVRIDKFCEKYRLSENINLDNLVKKNRITENQKSNIVSIESLLKSTFNNNYDIQFYIEPIYKTIKNNYGHNYHSEILVFDRLIVVGVDFIIHFPEFIITNSQEITHKIKDLYVKIPVILNKEDKYNNIVSNLFEIKNLKGSRGTIDVIEHIEKYRHSHLQSCDMQLYKETSTDYTKFCLGSGDIIANTSLLNCDFNLDLFQLLLYNIQNYVVWESLEGGPYKNMIDIISKTDAPKLFNNMISITNLFIDNLKLLINRDTTIINIDWKYNNGKYIIVDNNKFDKLLTDLRSILMYNTSYNDYWYYRDEKGNYFKEQTININTTGISTIAYIPFRKQKRFFSIYANPQKIITDRTYYCHPKIKEHVRQKLEYYTNKYKIRESRITTKNTTNIK